MRIGFLVEGTTDQGVVPSIAGKILARDIDPVFANKRGGGINSLLAKNNLERLLRALKHSDVRVAVVVVDNDGRPAGERMDMIEKRVPPDGAKPSVVAVAVQMIEAWLLACPEAFQDVFKKALYRKKMPEEYNDPKREIINPYLKEHTEYRSLNKYLGNRIASSSAYDINSAIACCPSLSIFADKLRIAAGDIS